MSFSVLPGAVTAASLPWINPHPYLNTPIEEPFKNPIVNDQPTFSPIGSTDHSVEYNSYAGSDIVCTLFIPVPDKQSVLDAGEGGVVGSGVISVMMELQTLTVSSARSVHPVRRLGEIVPANYTRGARTIAGTMIFTTLFRDAFALAYQKSVDDGETDLGDFFVDQIPRFNILINAANEFGFIANSVLTDVHLTNFGTTLSIDDIYTESSYTYVARNFYPFVADPIRMHRFLTGFNATQDIKDLILREMRIDMLRRPLGSFRDRLASQEIEVLDEDRIISEVAERLA